MLSTPIMHDAELSTPVSLRLTMVVVVVNRTPTTEVAPAACRERDAIRHKYDTS
jgi:hypothetical protein